jgi:hypothetical protein
VNTRTPYPDDIHFGAIYAIAARHFPDKASVSVRYDEHLARRDKGGDMTRVEVVWQ